MFTACLRLVLHVVLSPRRLIVAALLATFVYAAVVATKARLFPEPTFRDKSVAAAPARSPAHGTPATGGTRTE